MGFCARPCLGVEGGRREREREEREEREREERDMEAEAALHGMAR